MTVYMNICESSIYLAYGKEKTVFRYMRMVSVIRVCTYILFKEPPHYKVSISNGDEVVHLAGKIQEQQQYDHLNICTVIQTHFHKCNATYHRQPT